MLFFHAVTQVGVELGDFVVSVVKELVALDHQEVSIELLHSRDLGKLRIHRDLI